MVEGTGLENRQARKRLEGSNPSPSAIIQKKTAIFCRFRRSDLRFDLNAVDKRRARQRQVVNSLTCPSHFLIGLLFPVNDNGCDLGVISFQFLPANNG